MYIYIYAIYIYIYIYRAYNKICRLMVFPTTYMFVGPCSCTIESPGTSQKHGARGMKKIELVQVSFLGFRV